MLTFACLSFGQTSTGGNEGTASLYSYFASTAVILLLVRKLPPHGRCAGALDARPPGPLACCPGAVEARPGDHPDEVTRTQRVARTG